MGNGSITAGRNDLAAAVTYATTGISKRPGIPIMTGMTVSISGDAVTFAAFDCDTHVSAKVHGLSPADPGSVLVNGKDLAAAVKSLPAGKRVTAMFTITDDVLVISCGGIESTLAKMDASEYPPAPPMPAITGLAEASVFLASLARVTPAAGTDDTLPVLTHVCITSEAGKLEMATTDRYRLAVDRIPWTGPDDTTVIFPAVTLAGFAKVADRSGKISVHVGDTHTALSDGTHTVIARTIDPAGRPFPKYGQFFRTDHDTVVTVDASQLRDAMVRAGKLSGKRDRTGFDVTSAGITVTAENEGTPVGVQRVTALEVDGPDYLTGFHAPYLASLLAGFDGPVRIGFKTTTRTDLSGTEHTSQGPAILAADDTSFTAVCMPLRAKNQ
jgi:DNA polymerase III subunit beta